jgi:hypothetical protein
VKTTQPLYEVSQPTFDESQWEVRYNCEPRPWGRTPEVRSGCEFIYRCDVSVRNRDTGCSARCEGERWYLGRAATRERVARYLECPEGFLEGVELASRALASAHGRFLKEQDKLIEHKRLEIEA